MLKISSELRKEPFAARDRAGREICVIISDVEAEVEAGSGSFGSGYFLEAEVIKVNEWKQK